MLKPIFLPRFKKELQRAQKRGKNMEKYKIVVDMLLKEIPLSAKYRNHKLKGDYAEHWECHIEPDWLLIYQKTSTEILFIRTGSHSDLF